MGERLKERRMRRSRGVQVEKFETAALCLLEYWQRSMTASSNLTNGNARCRKNAGDVPIVTYGSHVPLVLRAAVDMERCIPYGPCCSVDL